MDIWGQSKNHVLITLYSIDSDTNYPGLTDELTGERSVSVARPVECIVMSDQVFPFTCFKCFASLIIFAKPRPLALFSAKVDVASVFSRSSFW